MHAAPPALARLFDQSATGISSPPPQECARPPLCSRTRRASARGLAPACSWPLPRAPLQLINYSRARRAAGAGSLCRIRAPPTPVPRTPKAGGPDPAVSHSTPTPPVWLGQLLPPHGTPVPCAWVPLAPCCAVAPCAWPPPPRGTLTPLMQQGQPAAPRHPTAGWGWWPGRVPGALGGFCASSRQGGLHLVRCCWGRPALGVTKHGTDGHVPGQVAVVTGLGHPGDTQPGAGSAKPLPAAAPACRGAQVQAARGTMCTHPNTRTPCWLGCTDTRLHRQTDTQRQTDRHRQTKAHTHTHRGPHGQTDGLRGTQAHAQTGTHRYTHTQRCRQTDTQVHTHRHIQGQNPKHTNTQMCSHGCLHTCAHAQPPSQVCTPTGERAPDAALRARARLRRHNGEQKHSQTGARTHTHTCACRRRACADEHPAVHARLRRCRGNT